MRIIIEEYRYEADAVKDVLKGLDALEDVQGRVCLNYVGYFYNTELRDCVFILPKVLLEVKDGVDMVFGKYRPEDIINLDSNNPLTQTERDFIYEFAVWIYRAIVVFKQSRDTDTSIVYSRKIAQAGRGKRKLSNTFLDILLSLVQFNKDNKSFFFFVLRNLHSGYNKINWTRTIAKSKAIVENDSPVYLDPVNKKRQINFDEELLVIFFSILNYIADSYGFPKDIDCNFSLIKGKQFKAYMSGLGKVRLMQIKYKYFSDKALELWHLCYAFFDYSKQIRVNSSQKEYLLVKNFNIVFEAIIDELVGDKNLPRGLKKQDDGKRVDHMYTYKGLTTKECDDKPIYYIGDSKYYKRGNAVGRESVYKQFTYARNVIQWNLELFMDGNDSEDKSEDRKNFMKVPKLRDDVTEGYNIIPNFFISASMNKDLSYTDPLMRKVDSEFNSLQFENRLFDRDTLLISHYDVNFLYVVALYARNNRQQKQEWKSKVRDEFRRNIQELLAERYDFYAMEAHPEVDAKEYIQQNFQKVLGKMFTPYGCDDVFSLALDKSDPEHNNDELLGELEKYFFVKKCNLGEDPIPALQPAKSGYTVKDANDDEMVMISVVEQDGIDLTKTTNKAKYVKSLLEHRAEFYYTGANNVSSTIDLFSLRFFAPLINHKIEGYYKIVGMRRALKSDLNLENDGDNSMRLVLMLGEYTPISPRKVSYNEYSRISKNGYSMTISQLKEIGTAAE